MKLTTTETTRGIILRSGWKTSSYSWWLQMLRFSLFMTSVVAASASAAGAAPRYSADTVPIQITNETKSGPETTLSAAGISSSDPHFRAFVTAITEHVAAR